MQSKKWVYYISIMLVIILAVGISGCGSSTTSTTTTTTSTTTEQSKYGGTLRILTGGMGAGNIGIPWEIQQNGDVIYPGLDRLINIDYDGITQGLATDWVIADDGKSVTFTLRQGVKFQDGTTFDAEAEKWNLDQWMAAHQEGTETWTSVEVINEYTIRINMTEYQNSTLTGLAGGYCGPISPTAYEQNGHDWAEKNPCGTGPFKLVNINPDVGWKWERNEEYWQPGKPFLDAIEYEVFTDLNVAKMKMENGEANVLITTSGATDVKVALQDAGFVLVPYGAGGEAIGMLPDALNPDSPWSKKEVRLAADYALNKEDLASLGRGMGEPSYQVAPPGVSYYDPTLGRHYDTGKAQELLQQAGYGTGFDTVLNYTSDTFPTDFALAIQSYFADVGIRMELNLLPPAAAFGVVTQGWQNGLLGIPVQSPVNFPAEMEKMYGSHRILFVSSLTTPELQELIDQGLRTTSLEEQNQWSAQINKYMYDEAVVIPFYMSLYYAVKTPSVHDDNIGIMSYFWTPADVWLSK